MIFCLVMIPNEERTALQKTSLFGSWKDEVKTASLLVFQLLDRLTASQNSPGSRGEQGSRVYERIRAGARAPSDGSDGPTRQS